MVLSLQTCALLVQAGPLACLLSKGEAPNGLRVALAPRADVEELLSSRPPAPGPPGQEDPWPPRAVVWVDPTAVASSLAPVQLSFLVGGAVRHMAFPFKPAQLTHVLDAHALSQARYGNALRRGAPGGEGGGGVGGEGGAGGGEGPSGRGGAAGPPPPPRAALQRRRGLLALDAVPAAAVLSLPAQSWEALSASVDRLVPALDFFLADVGA